MIDQSSNELNIIIAVKETDYELAIFARVLGVSLEWLTGDLEQKE